MNDITNSKIESLIPKWKLFHGMSLLFDNPGESLSHFAKIQDQVIRKIDCSPEINFYSSIQQCLQDLTSDLPMNDYLFGRLPYSTFHITVNDFVHKDNLEDFRPESKARFTEIFDVFPGGLERAMELLPFLQNSTLIKNRNWSIRFRFSHLNIWGDQVLVAHLEPADQESEKQFDQLKKFRRAINDAFQELHGYSRDIKDSYSIHLSLAYFGNQQYGRNVKPLLELWNHHFQKKMTDKESKPVEIEFHSISLYGFTDMTTFFRMD